MTFQYAIRDEQINQGELPSELLSRTGFDKVSVYLAERGRSIPTINPKTGKETRVKVGKDDGYDMYLTNLPYGNGVQDMKRTVSSWYNPISDMDYARALDTLGEKYQLRLFGHGGSRGQWIVWQFRVPDIYVENDPKGGLHRGYLTIAEDRATGNKIFTNGFQRVFCENQFFQFLKNNRAIVSGQYGHLFLDIEIWFETERMKTVDAMNNMFTKPISDTNVTELANILFPMPQERGNVQKARQALESGFNGSDAKMTQLNEVIYKGERDHRAAMARQEAHMKSFFGLVDHYKEEVGENMAALFNAATHHESHSNLYRATGDARDFSLMFGSNANNLENAWAYVTK